MPIARTKIGMDGGRFGVLEEENEKGGVSSVCGVSVRLWLRTLHEAKISPYGTARQRQSLLMCVWEYKLFSRTTSTMKFPWWWLVPYELQWAGIVLYVRYSNMCTAGCLEVVEVFLCALAEESPVNLSRASRNNESTKLPWRWFSSSPGATHHFSFLQPPLALGVAG